MHHHKQTLCVHGIGYIGLATAALFANAGHRVTGFDVNERTIDRLRAGDPRTTEADLRAYVIEALAAGFTPSTEPAAADVHLICVPTPYDYDDGEADLAYVEAAGRTVAGLLRPGNLVILESTVPPGTTAEVLGPILEAGSGLRAGVDFRLAHCPETVLPGNIVHELVHNDRIVGGVDDESAEAAIALYEPVVEGRIHRAPDATTAEFVKLTQNASRDVNIAFANELAKLAREYGIDARDAIALANVHPRVNVLQPGPGVGGHCIPVDPLFLGHGSDSLDVIAAARRVNDGMPAYVAGLLRGALGTLEGRRVAVLGIAYKGDVDDARNSPGVQLVATLRGEVAAHGTEAPVHVPVTDGGDGAGPSVLVTDPHVTDPAYGVVDVETALAGADAAVIAADHDAYRDIDPDRVADLMAGRVIVDAKGLLNADTWRAAGFDLIRV